MSPSSSDWPGTPEGEELFAAYLEQRDAGAEALDFEEFCAQHPSHADELRRLHTLFDELEPFFDQVEEAQASLPLAPPSSQRYVQRGELGRGGMGVVVRVRDEHMQRDLAMKVVRPDSAPQRDASLRRRRLSRFLEEARITGALAHPGIVPVHDLGVDAEGNAFFTMPVVEGQTLASLLDRLAGGDPAWNRTRVLGVLLRVCEALGFAHARGVIHRDLKPANVMVGPFGETYVMDWGLARMLDEDTRERMHQSTERDLGAASSTAEPGTWTLDGDVVGTPAYMSPEQAEGDLERLSAASDVYSLGAILYHALALHAPYAPRGLQPTALEVLREVRKGPPDSAPLSSAPAELVAICDQAMQRDPGRRYPNLGAMADDLRAFLENRVVRAYESGALAEFKKWVRRHRGLAAGVSLALLVGVAGLAATAYIQARAKERVLRLSDLQLLDESIAEADQLWPAVPDQAPALRDWLERSRGLIARLPVHERELAALSTAANARAELRLANGEWTFTDTERRWRYEKLEELVEGLRALAAVDGPVPSVESRLAFAETLHARSIEEAAADWDAAREAIRSDPRFEGLLLEPQLGLVPLGPDPRSGLWEFAHLASGEPPLRSADGLLEVGPETGVVLVLLPGGRFLLGAEPPAPGQRSDAPNVDFNALADLEGPIHDVWIAPFFLAKFEWTRAQWERCSAEQLPREVGAGEALPMQPVTSVTWDEAERIVRHAALVLPTEAQWEFGCRAGTTTPFWGTPSGLRLEEAENVNGDGPLAVGRRLPNPFGIHDTLGNVMEWCLDRYGVYAEWEHDPETGELRSEDALDGRIARGSAYAGFIASESRASQRLFNDRQSAFPLVGLRAARRVERGR